LDFIGVSVSCESYWFEPWFLFLIIVVREHIMIVVCHMLWIASRKLSHPW
jgi:hypothetical protein